MFLGEHHRTIDNKGRIFIPAKFREELIKGIIVTKGFDEKCLFLFSKEGWERGRGASKKGNPRYKPVRRRDKNDVLRKLYILRKR